MKVLRILVSTLLAIIVLLPAARCEVYYVRGSSSNSTACPPQASPCLTLQEYAKNASGVLPGILNDVEFRFLSGEHSLSKPFIVERGNNITLKSANVASVWDSASMTVVVECKKYSYFKFSQVTMLSISGLTLHRCSSNDHYHKGALTFDFVANVSVQDIEFIDSLQSDVLANDVYEVFDVSNVISRSTEVYMNSFSVLFTVSSAEALRIKLSTLLIPSIFAFINVHGNPNQIDSSIILHNVTTSLGMLDNNLCNIIYSSYPFISQCANVNVMASVYIMVQGCNFSAGTIFYTGHSISISDTSVSEYQVGISITLFPMIIGEPKEAETEENSIETTNVIVSNCTFRKGVGDKLTTSGSSGALIITRNTGSDKDAKVVLNNLVFEGNNIATAFSTLSSIITLAYLSNVNIEGVNLTNNRGIPLLLINTTVHVYGENHFVGNHAFEGGGMSFMDDSFLILHNNSLLVFRDNYADNVGGAWYVSSEGYGLYTFGALSDYVSLICFIKLSPSPGSIKELLGLNISVRFLNNMASNGGNVLYGGHIGFCSIDESYIFDYGAQLLAEETIFIYEPKNDSSRLSSAPTRVCVCQNDHEFKCQQIFSLVEGIYPGQSFPVSVVTVGQRFGVVNGTVYAQIVPLPDQFPSEVESLQKSQLVGQPECTTLRYSIRSNNSMETVALTTRDLPVTQIVNIDDDVTNYHANGFITQLLLTAPVYVNVSLLNCPSGFMLSEESPECICAPIILKYNLTCDINRDNGTVQRSGDEWVSFLSSNQTTSEDGVVVSLHCPNGYCKQATQDIHLDDSDAQCNFNRSGILCGGCSHGLSIALGSDRCLECSNVYIALLTPFAVSGVLLVLFIQALDLTVAVGTINGLIFYANIVKSYESLFFVPGQTNILTVFISWLNLDLGIQSCFFNGLDGYIKTWLQFVFPLYIWILAGIIVLLSRYTTLISANNSVPVLATMFLLSYNKLLRTIITASSFVILEVPGNSSLAAWKFDANLAFLDTKHVVLFLTSLLVFTLAWLPYTLVLLFYQCLLPVNYKRGCRWVFQLKPFFDANFGPLKGKHLYWVGVLLLARAILLMIFVASSNLSDSALIAVAVVSMFLVLYSGTFAGHVYENWFLSLLENSFFVNLNILCVATYYAKLTRSNQAPVIYTSISITFLEFAGIVCYHCYKRVWSIYLKCRGNRRDYVPIEPHSDEPQREVVAVTHSELAICSTESRMSLREPLCDT